MSAGKILLVDDDVRFCRAVRASLRVSGFDVIDVHSGEEALEKLARELPDVVLLDMMLPGMSGLQTCRIIRATSTVPVVILSALSGNRDRTAALAAGANAYVTKPFSLKELLAHIGRTSGA